MAIKSYNLKPAVSYWESSVKWLPINSRLPWLSSAANEIFSVPALPSLGPSL